MDTLSTEEQNPTPDDQRPVSFAIVSTAEIAKNKVIPGLLSVPYAVLVGVSSRSREKAQAFVDEHCGGAPCMGMTHDEIFDGVDAPGTTATPRIDALYVPLPSGVRNSYLKRALELGKHVYSEKPHGGTVNELRAVLDLAASKNLQWMDGTMWYHAHRTKEMEERLLPSSSNASGNPKPLGKVRRVSASFTWGGGGLVDEAWREGGNGRTDPLREPMGMLGDSGHYPVSAVLWAFGWELPTMAKAVYTKRNRLGAIISVEAVLWFEDGGRAIVDASCELPHRSQFEIVCDNGILRVDDLVGGQGRSGDFGAYERPFVGASEYTLGDYTGRDTKASAEACDQVQCLLRAFCGRVKAIEGGGAADPEWSRRSLCTHTVLCAIFESSMRDGVDVGIVRGNTDTRATGYVIEGQTYGDLPTRDWSQATRGP
ncbi:unnamed protein product [Pseudo-nitzschia multistriata]|uniref:Uncharacterized protein n=1 Tax=Pseudo-nitzschia multistriata TaxID=183589 RepID=A0A448Z933_9STRA|nr:unnamed protein product [Pseudo-nitzschia multistriata]